MVTILIILAGCTTPSPSQRQGPMGQGMGPMQNGMHHMMVNSEEKFVVEMIPHHQEAVDTSKVILNSTNNSELKDLAQRIINAQTREIEMLENWKNEYYNGGYKPSYEEMMPNLQRLKGDNKDVAYIQGMIMHHRMAVMMAHQVLRLNPRPEVENFAQKVIQVQTSEIREMQQILKRY